jgi:hypothetical protein
VQGIGRAANLAAILLFGGPKPPIKLAKVAKWLGRALAKVAKWLGRPLARWPSGLAGRWSGGQVVWPAAYAVHFPLRSTLRTALEDGVRAEGTVLFLGYVPNGKGWQA